MATYTLQKAASGFVPVSVGFNDTGPFTIGFPMSVDQNLPQPYTPVVGDVIQLGWIPRGFLVLSAWADLAMSGTGVSTWFFGDSGPSNRISGSTDIVVSGMASRYYFLRGTPAVFYGNQVIPAMSLATQVMFTMTCNTMAGSGNLSGSIALRGTMDFQNSTVTPSGGAFSNSIDLQGISEII